MPAATKNLTVDDRIEAGADFIRVWKLTDSGGTAHNLTNLSFTAQFRPDFKSETKFTATVAIVGSSSAGIIKITIPDNETRDYARSAAAAEKGGMRGVWDLESVNSSDARVIRWLEGSWSMTDEVTR